MSFFRLLALHRRQANYKRTKPQTFRLNLELLESRTLVTADILASVPLAMYSTSGADSTGVITANASAPSATAAATTSSPAAAVSSMRYVLSIVDGSGNPITGPLQVGQTFWVQVSVQDLRSGLSTAGIAQAGTAVDFDSTLASTTGQVTAGASYPVGLTSSLSTPGQFSVNSSEQYNINLPNAYAPLGSGLFTLASVQMTANAPGALSFTTAFPPDNPTGAQSVIAVDADGAGNIGYVDPSNITQGTTSIQIAAAASQLTVTTQPPQTVAHGSTFDVKVAVQDGNGAATSFTGNVTIALANNAGGATLGGTTTVAVSGGVADFSNLTINNAGQGYTLQATASGLTSATTSAFNVAGDASQLAITTQPTASVTADSPLDVKVSAEDSLGTVVPNFTGSVSIALGANPGGSTLGGTTTVTASAGVADFSTLTLDKAGAGYTLVATSGSFTSPATNTFSVTAASASHLVVTTQPGASATAGSPLEVKVSAEDAGGNVDTSYNGNVTIALVNNPGSATLGGTVTVAAVNGVADFTNLTVNKAGTGYTLGATSSSFATVNTSAFDVTPAAVSQLIVTTQPPSSVTAGSAFDLKVTAEDQFGNVNTSYTGNVSIALAANPGSAALGGTLTVAATNGVADFSTLTLNKTGTGYTLLPSASGLSSTATTAINVTPATVTQLIVSQQPTTVASGAAFDVKIAAADQFGNTNTSFTGNVTLAIANNPATGALGGTLTVAAVNGVADFGNLTLDKVGTGYTLSASSGASTGVTTGAINVTPGTATQIVIATSPPASVTAGAPFDVKVNVQDANGNLATNFNGSVTIAIGNSPGTALGGTTTVNVTNGVADFSTLSVTKAADGYTLTATATSLTSATTSAFDVTAAAATQLAITTQPPSSVAAGNTFSLTAMAEDQFGNIDSNYSGNVTLAIANNPGTGTLSGTTTVTAIGGVTQFTGLSFDKSGSGYTVAASSGALTSATSTAINVTPASASQLVVTTQPNPNVTVNAGFTVQISAEDQFGNVDPNFTGNVTIALAANPNNATLGGTTTVAAVAGVATFSGLTLDTLGSGNSLQATNNALTSVTTNTFAVTAAGVATHLVVTTQPSANVTAGQTFDVKVSAEDDLGAVDTTFAGNVSIAIASNPGSGTLGGTLTATAANGVADFANLSLTKAGTGYTLQTTSEGLGSGTTTAVNVTAAAATQLVITTQPPSTTVAGTAFDVKVSAEDQFGNVDTSYTGSVALALANNPGSSTLGGTATMNATAGVADFSTLTLNKVGTGYTLGATSGALTSATTSALNVTPAAATQLIITTQPPGTTTAGSAFEVKLTAEDAFGNVDTNYTGSVTMALANNPTSATLGGTTTATAVAGVIDFTNLQLTKAGTGYTLQASATGVTSPATTAINVTPAAATQLVFTQVPSSVSEKTAFTVQVSAEDQFGNVDPTATGSVTIAIGTNPSGGTLGGTTTVSLASGVASFTGLTLDTVGTGYTLTATTDGLTAGTSAALNVTSGAATQVVITSQPPSSVTSATPFDVKVALEDADGNIDTSYSGNVTIAIANNPASGTLGGTTTVAVANGVADLSGLTLDKAGTGYTLTVTSGTLTSATTSATDVTVGAASQIVITSQPPTTAVAGSAFDVKMAVEDAGGNVVTDFTGNVTIALAGGPGGTLGGTTTVAAVNGVADFSGLSINTAGTGYTFTATSGALTSPTTTALTITPATATQFVVTTQPPTSVSAGTAFDVKVTAEDQFGNVDTSFAGNVAIALTAGTPTATGVTAKLGGTLTATAANGVADFSTLTIDKVGTGYQLTATSGSLTAATTTDITVVAGAATKLAVTAEPPSTVLVGSTFGVSVSVEDAEGNVVTGATGNVTLAIQTNPANGTLGGTTTAAVTNGVATFTGLSLNNVGNGYTLSATSGSLTAAQTTGISVAALGTFSGSVYVDTNNDGIRSGGEQGVAGVSLTFTGTTTTGQSVTQTTTTAADGSFSFQQLAPGNYAVTETVPSQYVVGQASPANGVVSNGNTQFTFRIDANSVVSGNNFAERGLQPQLLNRSYFIGSRM